MQALVGSDFHLLIMSALAVRTFHHMTAEELKTLWWVLE